MSSSPAAAPVYFSDEYVELAQRHRDGLPLADCAERERVCVLCDALAHGPLCTECARHAGGLLRFPRLLNLVYK